MTIALADRMGRIKPSPTAEAAARAAAMLAAGHPIIALTTGEPDFPTPAHIQQAATAAMQAGETRYTAVDGTPALKDAVRAKFLRENELDYARDEVIVSTGAKQVIFNAILATIGAGDEVVIPTPSWVSYPDMVKLAGGVPVLLPCGPETGFLPSADRLAAAITPVTRAIMLNAPGNPTGAVFSRKALQDICDVLQSRPDILVISDDIYEHIIYAETSFLTLAQVCPDLRAQVLTVNGVSKAYAMTGWRIGYGGGPAPLIAAMKTLQSQSTTNPSSVSQAAALAALNGGLETVTAQTAAFYGRRDRMIARLSSVDGLEVHTPDGAFYLFIGIADLLGRKTPDGQVIETEADLVTLLLEQAHVAVVGGAGFGMSPYIRLSFAAADDALDQAADRMIATLSSLT